MTETAGVEATTLPTGTVTFVFTDVVGSTAAWEEAPEPMASAMARHDVLIEGAVRSWGGEVVRPRGEGDSRFAVFARATDAVRAAVDIERALAAETWPTPQPIRVRLALHTGEAELRARDYYGSAVNRCARLRAIGHPGQILLSQATAELVRDDLPDGAALRDLGSHRLKDLFRPERVFQLCHPALEENFPRLRSLEAARHNLPTQPTPLVGRDSELAQLRQLLADPDVRLLTLTGPGGIGKTRLGLQLAAEVVEEFPDGAWFVPLAPVAEAQLVASVIGQAVGVSETPTRWVEDVLVEDLADKHVLLVLDNFEHLSDAAPLVARLHGSCPQLTMVVTSRHRLQLRGEREFAVPPLAVPDVTKRAPLPALRHYDAVALFIERATAASPDFAVTNENVPAIAAICARLDGLPLAIELAAARVRLLSPEAMLPRLERRLALLTGGARDLPERQRTLRTAIEWSYDLLDDPERVLFRRLSVFVGGFTLESAEAVCDLRDLGDTALDALGGLVDKSLVRRENDSQGRSRFGMLETIREFAAERLADAAETRALAEQHAAWYLQLVEGGSDRPYFSGDATDQAWVNEIRTELDNVRAALRFTLDAGDGEAALRLAAPLWKYWYWAGQLTEGRAWVDAALGLKESAPPSLIAKGLMAAGLLAGNQGDYATARTLLQESLDFWRIKNDPGSLAFCLLLLAAAIAEQGDFASARPLLRESLDLVRETGDIGQLGLTVNNAGEHHLIAGDYVESRELLNESVVLARRSGDAIVLAWSLALLGRVSVLLGHFDEARAFLDEALAANHTLGSAEVEALCYQGIGCLELATAQHDAATQAFATALSLRRDAGDRRMVAQLLEGLAAAAARGGQLVQAARLFGAAERIRDDIAVARYPVERQVYETHLNLTKNGLTEDVFRSAWQAGQDMDLEDVIDRALACVLEQPPSDAHD